MKAQIESEEHQMQRMAQAMVEYFEMRKKAQQLFDQHDIDAIYFLSDGTPYLDQYAAEGYSTMLSDNTITTITREEIESDLED